MKEFMQKFDKNKDGRIEMSEVRLSNCLSYCVWKAVIFIQGVVWLFRKHTSSLSSQELGEKINNTLLYVAIADH